MSNTNTNTTTAKTITLTAPGGGTLEVPASANAVDMFGIACLAGFDSFALFAEPIGLRLAYEWLGNENAKITAPTVERHMTAMSGPPSRARVLAAGGAQA